MPQQKPVHPNHNLFSRNGSWYIRYELGGRDQRRSLGTADVKVARKNRDLILEEIEDQRAGRQPEIVHTWQDAVEGYLELAASHIATKKLSPETVHRYQGSIIQITLALAGEPDADGHTEPVPLSTITKATVLDFVEARREEERASSTILNDLTAWSRVLAYATGKDWVEHNVVRNFDRRMFVGTKQAELNPPTDEQVVALVAEVSEWSAEMGLLIHWLRETGMRLAEALQLRAEDIHPDRRRATLSRGVKRGKVRTIQLGRATELLKEMPRHGRLFAG